MFFSCLNVSIILFLQIYEMVSINYIASCYLKNYQRNLRGVFNKIKIHLFVWPWSRFVFTKWNLVTSWRKLSILGVEQADPPWKKWRVRTMSSTVFALCGVAIGVTLNDGRSTRLNRLNQKSVTYKDNFI